MIKTFSISAICPVSGAKRADTELVDGLAGESRLQQWTGVCRHERSSDVQTPPAGTASVNHKRRTGPLIPPERTFMMILCDI